MGTRVQEADLDFQGIGKIIRALMNPVGADPGSPADGEMWYRTDTDVLRFRANGTTFTVATTADVSAGGVSASAWDAQSVVVAVADNTPVAQTLAASTVLGRRSTGDITAVSFANLKTDLEGLGIAASTLGGQNSAYHLARGNHTGSQAASTISDFASAAQALIDASINALIDSSPGTLDTLNELAAALGDDPNFATTITTSLGLKTEIYSANFGNGALQSFDFSHGFATTHVHVQVFRNSDGAIIDAGVVITDANTVTVTTITVPTTNAYRVEIIARNL